MTKQCVNRSWVRGRYLIGGLFLLASLLAAPGARAMDDPPGRVGRVADLRGQAWLQVDGQGEWVALQRNRPLTTADRLSTDRDSRLELEMGSTVVRLDSTTELAIQRLDDDHIDLRLQHGSAAVRIREPELIREFSLQTQDGTVWPRSTGLFRVDRGDPEQQISVFSGEVSYAPLAGGPDAVGTRVRSGQRLIIRPDLGGRAPELTWAALADDDFERWVRNEDARDVPRQARGPVSPEMTGADDLARHGQWQDHPDYGSVWTPTVVVAGWAPYRYGHWAYVVPWGWTWVDDAPWGFAPFHYGRWVYWGSRWCWAPGQYVRRPVYAPALVAWVGGGGPHWSASISVGPSVGWVPLAPREIFVPVYRSSPGYLQNVNISHVHLPPGYRPVASPGRPEVYANQGYAGGLTVVPAQVLQQRQPVGRAWQSQAEAGRDGAGSGLTGRLVNAAPPPAPLRAAVAPDASPGQVTRFGRHIAEQSGAEPDRLPVSPARDVRSAPQPAPGRTESAAPTARMPRPMPSTDAQMDDSPRRAVPEAGQRWTSRPADVHTNERVQIQPAQPVRESVPEVREQRVAPAPIPPSRFNQAPERQERPERPERAEAPTRFGVVRPKVNDGKRDGRGGPDN